MVDSQLIGEESQDEVADPEASMEVQMTQVKNFIEDAMLVISTWELPPEGLYTRTVCLSKEQLELEMTRVYSRMSIMLWMRCTMEMDEINHHVKEITKDLEKVAKEYRELNYLFQNFRKEQAVVKKEQDVKKEQAVVKKEQAVVKKEQVVKFKEQAVVKKEQAVEEEDDMHTALVKLEGPHPSIVVKKGSKRKAEAAPSKV